MEVIGISIPITRYHAYLCNEFGESITIATYLQILVMQSEVSKDNLLMSPKAPTTFLTQWCLWHNRTNLIFVCNTSRIHIENSFFACILPLFQTATNSANINEHLFSRAHGLQHITLMKSSSSYSCSCMCYETRLTYKPQWETQSICVSNQSRRNLPIEEAWKQSGLEELQKNFSNIIT